MTASTLSHLPLAAGSAVLAGLGRAGLWAIARYMRAPLANTGMLALATMTATAGTNALYNQHTEHPAPLFAPSPVAPVPAERPNDLAVVPALQGDPQTPPEPQMVAAPAAAPAPLTQPVTGETTGSVAPVVPDEPVGNVEVFQVQKKLLELEFFEGEVDGYYGPMTARAIRAFEERNGLTPEGALTPAVVKAILEADAEGRMPAPAPAPTVATAPPAEVPSARSEPRQMAAASTPAPAPAAAPIQVSEQPDILIGPVESRSNPIDTVVASATETIDSIISELDTRGTPERPAERPVPALPLLAEPDRIAASQPMPEAIVPAQRPAVPANRTAAVLAAPAPTAALQPARQEAANAAPQASEAPARPPAAARSTPQAAATNRELVMQVQRGLASLGFLHGAIDGQANETTARAIRNFEVYHNYRVTGQVSPELVDMLVGAGASI